MTYSAGINCVFSTELSDAILKFVIDSTSKKQKKEAEACLSKLHNQQIQIEDITHFWEQDPQVSCIGVCVRM